MLALTADDGERAVLRLLTKQPWRSAAAGLLKRESETQQQLAGTGVPVPKSLAVDLDGATAGTPAHLMTWLPGSLELHRDDDDLVDKLARMLKAIHAHDPGGTRRPRVYQSWALPSKRVVPEWAQCPALWERAFKTLEQPPPPYRGAFLHRDYHLGNILWHEGVITGVVDWVETSWGPVALDAAHSTTYLAMLHGSRTANRFSHAFRDLDNEETEDARSQAYWQILDIVGYLPDPAKVVQPWRDVGRAISDELARARLEEYLAAVLER